MKCIIGIDEAGRGSWAWPLIVAWISAKNEKIFQKIPEIADSKKLSETARERIFEALQKLHQQGEIMICIVEKTAQEIDEKGIRECNREAMEEIICTLSSYFSSFFVKIDGADNFTFSHIDAEYVFAQKKSRKKSYEKNALHQSEDCVKKNISWQNKNFIHFIIWWDSSESIISAASIIAKVHRDSIMKGFSKDFPEYNFWKNKGYGTQSHHEAIINYGINFLHRKTYKPIKALIFDEKSL